MTIYTNVQISCFFAMFFVCSLHKYMFNLRTVWYWDVWHAGIHADLLSIHDYIILYIGLSNLH